MMPGDHLTIWNPRAPSQRAAYTVWAVDDQWVDIIDRDDVTGKSRQRLPKDAFKEKAA